MRPLWLLSFGVCACVTETEPRFGPPNTWYQTQPPDPTRDAAAVPPIDASSCADAGACAVKFSTDIFPLMQDTGAWGCSKLGICHGPNSVKPEIDNADPSKAYNSLRAFQVAGKPYILPCSTNKAESSFRCNLEPPGSAGVCGSSMPKGTPAAAGDLQKLETWISCGAPNN